MSNLISLNSTFKGQKLELNKIKFHLGYSSAALIFSQIKFPPIDITGEKQIIGDRPREREATFPFRPVYCRAQVSVSTNFCWGTSRRNSNGLSPVKRSKKKLTWMVTGIGHDRCLNASRFLPIPLIPGHAVSRVRPLQPETSSTLYMTSGSNRIIHCPGRMTWTSDLQWEECRKYNVPPGAEIFKNIVPICDV